MSDLTFAKQKEEAEKRVRQMNERYKSLVSDNSPKKEITETKAQNSSLSPETLIILAVIFIILQSKKDNILLLALLYLLL